MAKSKRYLHIQSNAEKTQLSDIVKINEEYLPTTREISYSQLQTVLDNENTSSLLPPGCLWTSDNNHCLLVKESNPARIIKFGEINPVRFYFQCPDLYYGLNLLANNKYYVTSVFIQDEEAFIAFPFPNVFKNGNVCTHIEIHDTNHSDTLIDKTTSAIEGFWDSIFNLEVNDFMKHKAYTDSCELGFHYYGATVANACYGQEIKPAIDLKMLDKITADTINFKELNAVSTGGGSQEDLVSMMCSMIKALYSTNKTRLPEVSPEVVMALSSWMFNSLMNKGYMFFPHLTQTSSYKYFQKKTIINLLLDKSEISNAGFSEHTKLINKLLTL